MMVFNIPQYSGHTVYEQVNTASSSHVFLSFASVQLFTVFIVLLSDTATDWSLDLLLTSLHLSCLGICL